MGVLVDLVEEIRDRLSSATASGQPLESVNQVTVMEIERARKLNDFPVINISLVSLQTLDTASNSYQTDEITLDIRLIDEVLDSETTGITLFEILSESGPLYNIEKVQNVLYKTTSGVVDPTFGSKAHGRPSLSARVDDQGGELVETVFELTVQTRRFAMGDR